MKEVLKKQIQFRPQTVRKSEMCVLEFDEPPELLLDKKFLSSIKSTF